MSRLVVVLDLAADASLWDPHEAIEDVLARADDLPTFEPGMGWYLTAGNGDHVEGSFVAAEWVDDDYELPT